MKPIVRYMTLNVGILTLLMLVILCITGAFLGAQKAALFFNAPPLAVFWLVLFGVLVAGFVCWRSLWRRPNLLLCHLGCAAVLAGGMWGSAAGHRLRQAVGWPSEKVKGTILLREGQSGSEVSAERGEHHTLPFSVRLVQTGVSHYDIPSLGIYNQRGELIGRLAAVVDGQAYELSAEHGIRVQVVQKFANLRLMRQDDGTLAGVEGDTGGDNPGYAVDYSLPDGSVRRQYVFERFEPHFSGQLPFVTVFLPPQMPKEYRSTLVLEKDGQTLAHKTIRVNDPLYYGGYHFYQSTFGRDEGGIYSGILVVSDGGVWCVFVGYGLMTAGLFGQFWLRPLLRRRGEGQTDAH